MKNISVIIPVFNRPRLVKRAIESVLRQTRPAYEILVIDDGSGTETAQVLQRYGQKIQYFYQENKGVSAARNKGIQNAKGDWLAFLDSDDEWLPQKLEFAYGFWLKNPQCRIFQTEEIWVRRGRRVNPKQKHKKIAGWIFRESLPLCIVSPSAVLIEAALFSESGVFDEAFPVCEDYDLWLRILKKYPICLDERPGIIKYGGHSDQLSKKFWGMDRWRIKALEKHLKDVSTDKGLRRAVLLEINKKLSILIKGTKKRGRDCPELEEKLQKYEQELKAIS